MPTDEYQEPEPAAVSLRWLNTRLIIVVAVVSAIVSALVCAGALLLVQSQSNAGLRTNSINGCDGTNLLRGFARLATHQGRPTRPDPDNIADSLLRIRDCEATYDLRRVVTVGSEEEYRFLLRLSRNERVAVRDGGNRFERIQ